MRIWVWLAVAAIAAPAAAQRHKIDINTETPEGQLLQQIGITEDEGKKLALLEEFAAKYPTHAGLPWVYGQLQPRYLKASQFDKVFPVVEKLLESDPTDVEMAHGALKAAEGKKEAELIIQWSALTTEAAKKAEATKQPEDEDEAEAWKHKVEFARQVQKYAEYSIYAAALTEQDPGKKLLLMDTLAQKHPESEYNKTLSPQYFLVYRQAGNTQKALEVALKQIAAGDTNEDMLLVVTDHYFNQKDSEKVLEYSARLVEVMKTKPAPQGVSAEDWERKKNVTTGVALWMAGMTHASKSQWSQTDTVLREALPLLAGNDTLLSHATFQLGLANMRIGESSKDGNRIQAALNYFRQCAGIKGPSQGTAARNVKAIQAQYRGLK
jgi:tetratricopeptide (TPR) repeat protein